MPRNPPIDPKLQRREAALRANLARRKAQVQERQRAQQDRQAPVEVNSTDSVELGPDLD